MKDFMMTGLLWICVATALVGNGLVYGMLVGLVVSMFIQKENVSYEIIMWCRLYKMSVQ